MISIFANFRMSDSTRLEHMKDSFNSFKNISNDWLINVRGDKRQEAIDFLKRELGDKLNLFEFSDEKYWARDSLKMMKKARHDYILFWDEDHINIASQELYPRIMSEMKKNNVDYLMYSWWLDGRARKPFEVPEIKKGEYVDTVFLTKKIWKKQLKKGVQNFGKIEHCLTVVQGIYKKDFLLKITKGEINKWPRIITTFLFFIMMILDKVGIKFHHRRFFDFLNRIFFGKLTKRDFGPFDMEKSPYRWDILPFKMGLTKQELFADIDSETYNPVEEYPLIRRGLYPINFELKINDGVKEEFEWGKRILVEKNDFYTIHKIMLDNGKKYSRILYQKNSRIYSLPKETLINMGDEFHLRVADQETIVHPDEVITIHPNLPHEITAKNDNCQFLVIIPNQIDI